MKRDKVHKTKDSLKFHLALVSLYSRCQPVCQPHCVEPEELCRSHATVVMTTLPSLLAVVRESGRRAVGSSGTASTLVHPDSFRVQEAKGAQLAGWRSRPPEVRQRLSSRRDGGNNERNCLCENESIGTTDDSCFALECLVSVNQSFFFFSLQAFAMP